MIFFWIFWDFWDIEIFLYFLEFIWIFFLLIFGLFLVFFWIFGILLIFWFWWFKFFLDIFFLPKLLRLLLKVIEVSTEHQKWPKISKNHEKPFFAQRVKIALAVGQSPPQELEVSLRSGQYLLVCLKIYIQLWGSFKTCKN